MVVCPLISLLMSYLEDNYISLNVISTQGAGGDITDNSHNFVKRYYTDYGVDHELGQP